jgi:hypothetical protein
MPLIGACKAMGMVNRVATGSVAASPRYAVDRGWVVSHSEKMAYGDVQLLGLYARLGTRLGAASSRTTRPIRGTSAPPAAWATPSSGEDGGGAAPTRRSRR